MGKDPEDRGRDREWVVEAVRQAKEAAVAVKVEGRDQASLSEVNPAKT